MKMGFIRAAAATPEINVGDCKHNKDKICELIENAYEHNAQIVVFPELSITGYTCGDLFWQSLLLKNAKSSLIDIAEYSSDMQIIAIVGLPLEYEGKLYNTAAVIYEGEILGIVPKSYIPNYSEFYEKRHFTSGIDVDGFITIGDEEVPFGTDMIFKCSNIEGFSFGIEICEDLWVPNPPSTQLAVEGAMIICNLSASDEVTGKDIYRRNLVNSQSARTISAYIYADAGEGESSTDVVFAAHNMISENGTMLTESARFCNETVFADIDLDRLICERRRMTTFETEDNVADVIEFEMNQPEFVLDRKYDKAPFVPSDKLNRDKRCEEILSIQSMGLKKRMKHTHCSHAVIGISGGLDSTLALLVTVRAMDYLQIPRNNLIAVTMPGYGTTDRTYNNAVALINELGATFKEINISKAVDYHFEQIGHDKNIKDVTYENAQARQRTYLLMDIANKHNGMVIGTGDMSELALGWATYNGDHMSMYGVNAGVPKTLVRHLVKYYADTCGNEKLRNILEDILNTPVSPELLPPEENGEIAQKTEDLVGPYELHDFFLYYVLRFGYSPNKILFLADNAFKGIYAHDVIKKWLKVFYRRFFAQQFKRSCLPDGPKVGSVAVSPRGDLRMPSDACVREWIEDIERS
ncbi:MAG: NAD(+) synthase [Eubacterium sp.]